MAALLRKASAGELSVDDLGGEYDVPSSPSIGSSEVCLLIFVPIVRRWRIRPLARTVP